MNSPQIGRGAERGPQVRFQIRTDVGALSESTRPRATVVAQMLRSHWFFPLGAMDRLINWLLLIQLSESTSATIDFAVVCRVKDPSASISAIFHYLLSALHTKQQHFDTAHDLVEYNSHGVLLLSYFCGRYVF